MADPINIPPSPVLPLPPINYDPQYMLNLVRLLNFYIQQADNPGVFRCSRFEAAHNSTVPDLVIDTRTTVGETLVTIANLPVSAAGAGLATDQVYRTPGNVLQIV